MDNVETNNTKLPICFLLISIQCHVIRKHLTCFLIISGYTTLDVFLAAKTQLYKSKCLFVCLSVIKLKFYLIPSFYNLPQH